MKGQNTYSFAVQVSNWLCDEKQEFIALAI